MSVRLASRNKSAPARSPEREALSAAIAHHVALKATLDEVVANSKRAEGAKFTAIRAVDAANKALSIAHVADAEAVAEGRAGGAVKKARRQLQDAEDAYESCKAAQALTAEQHADLSSRLNISRMTLGDAVAAVVRNEVTALIERYETARREFHDLHGVLGELFTANALPRELNVAVQNIDINQVVHKDLPPSPIAVKVKTWIERLRDDADAMLAYE
jgi:hypothetical protein